MPLIEIKNLSKKFDDFIAVDNVSLEINEGEIFGLLGAERRGKTTTLSILATLLPPTSGNAVINGYDVAKHPTRVRRSIGLFFKTRARTIF